MPSTAECPTRSTCRPTPLVEFEAASPFLFDAVAVRRDAPNGGEARGNQVHPMDELVGNSITPPTTSALTGREDRTDNSRRYTGWRIGMGVIVKRGRVRFNHWNGASERIESRGAPMLRDCAIGRTHSPAWCAIAMRVWHQIVRGGRLRFGARQRPRGVAVAVPGCSPPSCRRRSSPNWPAPKRPGRTGSMSPAAMPGASRCLLRTYSTPPTASPAGIRRSPGSNRFCTGVCWPESTLFKVLDDLTTSAHRMPVLSARDQLRSWTRRAGVRAMVAEPHRIEAVACARCRDVIARTPIELATCG
jgi:hypothetical protein